MKHLFHRFHHGKSFSSHYKVFLQFSHLFLKCKNFIVVNIFKIPRRFNFFKTKSIFNTTWPRFSKKQRFICPKTIILLQFCRKKYNLHNYTNFELKSFESDFDFDFMRRGCHQRKLISNHRGNFQRKEDPSKINLAVYTKIQSQSY